MAPEFKPTDWARTMNESFYAHYMAEVGKQFNSHWSSTVEPLAWIHLNSDVGFDQPGGNPLYLYGCAAVALFILVVACINYMNLATARATRARAPWASARSSARAACRSRSQFLGEAVIFSLLALVIGYVLVEVALTLTPITELMDDQVNQTLLRDPQVVATLVGRRDPDGPARRRLSRRSICRPGRRSPRSRARPPAARATCGCAKGWCCCSSRSPRASSPARC